jgi:sugar/nucleoside kinase (ribokinase family)
VVDPKKPSTRGLLEYQDGNFGRKYYTRVSFQARDLARDLTSTCATGKTFRYLTTPLQSSPSDLASTEMLQSRAFHFLASPQDLEEHIRSLRSFRAERCPSALAPLLVWEPAPLACKRENLEDHLGVCKLVDVFSPNHLELAALCGGDDTAEGSVSATFSRTATELYARKFLDAMSDQGLIVIRCGEHGCLVLSHQSGAQWLPAYHEPTSPKIIDTTGAGNTFLGGFSIGLLQTGDPREAAVYGSVAASFVVEQISVPSFRPATPTSEETWNGESVDARLQEYRKRTAL